MIVGIGADVTNASRIKSIMEETAGFFDRVFTAEEQRYCKSKVDPWPHFAARFAAKEALIKAWGQGIAHQEIEISLNGDGQPEVQFFGKIAAMMKQKKVTKAHISYSHEGDIVMAVALLEQ